MRREPKRASLKVTARRVETEDEFREQPSERPVDAIPADESLKRVLLVEDDELVAAGLAALLEMEGMAVLVIGRGLPVVKAVESFQPEAVILDLTLPDIGGIEVFRRLRGRWPQLPIVFSTGHASSTKLSAELSGDRVELLRKPYEIDELLAALQRITAV
ncbi:MAG TPA: response regulator [Thermoanaerobaculia bacterium]|jgi:two-component system OmpR family response regulator|nr:response regulator [Thermoanaerobaculia bacterium]